MNGISTFLQVNSALITGLLGMLGALGGVIITNYYNSKNNDKNINFNLRDRDRERKFNLRKEIYLEAVDSIVEFEAILGGVATANDLDEFNIFHREQTKKLKKLELISDMDISLKVNELSMHFRNLINYIIVEKTPLIREQIDLDQALQKFEEIESLIKNIDRDKLGGDKRNSTAKLLALKSEREKLKIEISFKVDTVLTKQKNLGMEVINSFDNISELIGDIYTGFRNDFGLDKFDKSKHDLTKNIEIKKMIDKKFNEMMKSHR